MIFIQTMVHIIRDNRLERFLQKITIVSTTQLSSEYIDTSPNDVFTGPIGTVLVKNGKDILYKYPTDDGFTIVSQYFPELIRKYQTRMEIGINYRATWIKTSSVNEKQWKLIGYVCPFDDVCDNCPPTYYT